MGCARGCAPKHYLAIDYLYTRLGNVLNEESSVRLVAMNTFPITSQANTTGFVLLSSAASLLVGSVVWKNKTSDGTMSDISWTAVLIAICLAIVGNSILFTFD